MTDQTIAFTTGQLWRHLHLKVRGKNTISEIKELKQPGHVCCSPLGSPSSFFYEEPDEVDATDADGHDANGKLG